jgi:hypothetical protein
MKSKPFPTQLTLINFSPTSIDIGWDNITRANLCNLNANECLEVLRRTPALEYCLARTLGRTPWSTLVQLSIHTCVRYIFHPERTKFLDAINVPSLEEWILQHCGDPLPVTAMVSFLQRSGCCLKILNLQRISAPPDDLSNLFQAMPSLERLQLHLVGRERRRRNGRHSRSNIQLAPR